MISNIPVKSLPNQTVRVEVKFDEQKHFYFLIIVKFVDIGI